MAITSPCEKVHQPDHFIEGGGYKQLCVAMMKEAAQSIARNRQSEEAQESIEWLNGHESAVPFNLCLAVLGLEGQESRMRAFILDNPRQAAVILASAQEQPNSAGPRHPLADVEAEAEVMTSYRRAARHVA